MKDNPLIFANKAWRLKSGADAKIIVYNNYIERTKGVDWNSERLVPIIPAVHGTDFEIAMAICSTGFAALSSLYAQKIIIIF